MKLLLIFFVVATCTSARAMVCFHGICDTLKKHVPLQCNGSVIKNGGFCGCFDVCAKQEGEECTTEFIRGRLPVGTCDTGLTCVKQMDMMIGIGKCVKTPETNKTARETTQTLCQRRRIQSMIVQIVYAGQWFPKCDAEGLFELEQCDNQGMCFCVDAHTGEIDLSTKVKGSANCETNSVQVRELQTTCERRRIQAMTSMVVYAGKWVPKCDDQGLFESEQCDNRGLCFCVNVYSGEVDLTTMSKGTADCGTDAVQAREVQTPCERRRIQSMISLVVYPGQWFPKCDAEGLFEPEQCDNQGMCFCVNVHSGEVDLTTKVKGSADCETNAVQARATQTVCERQRIHSMMVMIVYPGQWFPRCDAQGLFMAEQCDNQHMCFCVDVNTGEVDESTKVLGSANC